MTIKLFDCTLRDGGYYNNWDFEPATVQNYLDAMASAGVDMVEVGFRLKPAHAFLGAFAYCTDDYLAALNVPPNLALAVMINASEFVSEPQDGMSAVDAYFAPAASSPVSMVRIALRAREIAQAKPVAQRLKVLGYQVAINLMQVDALGEQDLSDAAREIDTWGAVDVLYFADSLGNLEPDSTRRIVNTLLSAWPGALGFHSHDNKGQALVNCMAAVEAGITWLDGTILGMGRGAGNVRTESLLIELIHRKLGSYNLHPLYSIVMEDFTQLHKHYNWGPNFFYHMAAVKGIHPTYVQELLGSSRYSLDEVLAAIEYLGGTGARSYSSNTLGVAVRSPGKGSGEGTWRPSGWALDRDMLIIGSGPSTARHITAITNYIRKKQPIVLCLNVNRAIKPELVTAYVACHESRILIESSQYSTLGRPVILPLARVPDEVRPLLQDVEIFDYGLEISATPIELGETGCKLPSTLAVAYAIAVAKSSGATRILMAGFDGYVAGDSRQEEMIVILEQYHNVGNVTPIISVTPTTYPITQRSIYELVL